MLKNFEEYTQEITDYDLVTVVPMVVDIIKAQGRGKGNTITNKAIRTLLHDAGVVLGSPKIRKIIHYIRVRGVLPYVCATSTGYYIAESRQEMEAFILSLEQREDSIRRVRRSLQIQLADAKILNSEEAVALFAPTPTPVEPKKVEPKIVKQRAVAKKESNGWKTIW